MKRAAVILTSNELEPYWGLVFYDDDKETLDAAVQREFEKQFVVPDGDTAADRFEDMLGDYTYFFIPKMVGDKLNEVELPEVDIEHLYNTDDAARLLLHQLMISVCERFAYTSRFSRIATPNI